MGFNIHVVGSSQFHRSRHDIPYGDDWELSWMEDKILSHVGVSQPPSLTGETMGHLLSTVNRLQQVNLLVQCVTLLMARAHRGSLNVTIRRSHALWPTTGGFRSFNLSGTHAPGFAINLCGFLADNGLDKWGPVIEMTDALVRFENHLTRHPGHSPSLINATLSD